LQLGFPEDMENMDMDEFSDGGQAIHLAAMHGSVKVLRLFLQHETSRVKLINSQKNPSKDTPLHLACRFMKNECAQTLLQYGADKTLKNSHALTAEQVAKGDVKSLFQ